MTTTGMKSMVMAALCMAAFVGGAAEIRIWKASGAADYTTWTNSENFENGAPQAGDSVALPAGISVSLNASDTASAALVSSLAVVLLQGEYSGTPARLVVTVNADDPNGGILSVGCKVRGASGQYETQSSCGLVEKFGTGEFFITDANDKSQNDRNCCATSYTVHGGTLRLPQAGTTNGERATYKVHVAEGATLVSFGGSNANAATTYFSGGLTGSGLVTNEMAASLGAGLIINGVAVGILTNGTTIGGAVSITPKDNLYLAATNSTASAGVRFANNKTHFYVQAAGGAGEPSSIGTSGFSVSVSETAFHYLGDVVTSSTRNMDIFNVNDGQSMLIDGGPYGGLGFDKYTMWHSRQSLANVVLDGDGATENVFLGYVQGYSSGDLGLTLTKRGAGTWRLGDPSLSDSKDVGRIGVRGIYVEEGTLAADTLYDRGHMSAIGHSVTNLPYGFKGTKADAFSGANYVDYPLAIGGTNGTEGTFAYTGSSGVYVTNLPFAVVGDARLENRSASAFCHLGGISSRRAGTHTLTLGGDSAVECDVGNVTEQIGKINLVKEGAGTWSLVGTNAFTGGIDVKEGTLKVANHGAKYMWFKWVLKETYNEYYGRTSGDDRKTFIPEFGLFDVNSNRVNGALAMVADYKNIAPGQIALVTEYDYYGDFYEPDKGQLANLTDGVWTTPLNMYSRPKTGAVTSPRPDSEKSWLIFLMRLPADATEVASYDVSYEYRYWGAPKAWALYGSTDGAVWDLLDEKSFTGDLPKTNVNAYWLLANQDWSTPEAAAVHGGGQAIAGHAASPCATLPTVQEHVSVASGATLAFDGAGAPVTKLIVDGVDGLGTISGVMLAADGSIEFANIDRKQQEVSFPADLSGVSGLANLKNWTLAVNGQPAGNRYRLKATTEGLTLTKGGLLLIIR